MLGNIRINILTHSTLTMADDAYLHLNKLGEIIFFLPDSYKNGRIKRFTKKRELPVDLPSYKPE